jgi:hypothetical protein
LWGWGWLLVFRRRGPAPSRRLVAGEEDWAWYLSEESWSLGEDLFD